MMIFVQSNPGPDLKHFINTVRLLHSFSVVNLIFSISSVCKSIECVDKKNKVIETIRHEKPNDFINKQCYERLPQTSVRLPLMKRNAS